MGELEDFRAGMLARQAEAEEAIVHGDPEPRMALWSRRDPVTLFGAAGMAQSGWDALSETFRQIASEFSDVSDFSFEVVEAGVSGDLAYSIGLSASTGRSSAARSPRSPSASPTSTGARTASGRSSTATGIAGPAD
jgi:ketosteroid isomerase-like protein